MTYMYYVLIAFMMSDKTVSYVIFLFFSLAHIADTKCLLPDVESNKTIPAQTLCLDTNPTHISSGLTESLTVNCSFSFAEVSDMSGIISLIVSKSVMRENQPEQFIDLVSVNLFTPNMFNEVSDVHGIVEGNMDDKGDSFVSIQWPSPSAERAGLYRCEVNGVDNVGHPKKMLQTKLVTSQQPGLDQLSEAFGQLKRQLQRQENLLYNQSYTINILSLLSKNQSDKINNLFTLSQNQSAKTDNLSFLIENLTDEKEKLSSLAKTQSNSISALETQLDNQSSILTGMKSEFNRVVTSLPFYVSPEYNGHYYLLSRQDWNDANVSAKTCQDYGGYLVHIDSTGENQFLKDFINNHTGVYDVLMSGTDIGHEGRWTFTGTNTDLVFFDWEPLYPRTSHGWNCIAMWKGAQWRWGDYPCTHSYSDYKFMCEVETV